MLYLAPVLIVLISLAQYAPGVNAGFVNLYASRLAVMGTFAYVALIPGIRPRISKRVWVIISLYALWVIYAIMSYFWSMDKMASIKETFAIMYGFATLVAFALLSYRNRYYEYMIYGLWVSFVICGSIAVWEILTLNHLASSYVLESPSYVLLFPFAQSTFGNPNNYSSFLIMFIPIALMQWRKRRMSSLIAIVTIAFSLGIMFINASRISLAVAVGYIIYEISGIRKMHMSYKVLSVAAIVLAFYATLGEVSRYMELYIYNTGESSIQARLNMYKNALWMLGQSMGMGVGAGNFDYIVRNEFVPYYVGHNTSPHSLLFEVMSQYGILTLLSLTAAIYFTVKWIYAYESGINNNEISSARYINHIVILFVISSFQNSGYVVSPVTWLILGVATSYLNYRIVHK